MRNFTLIPHTTTEELGRFTEEELLDGHRYLIVHQSDWARNGFKVDEALIEKGFWVTYTEEDEFITDSHRTFDGIGYVAIAQEV